MRLESPLRGASPRAVGSVVLAALLVVAFLVWVRAETAPDDVGPGRTPPTAAQSVRGVTLLLETEPFDGPVAGVGLGGRLTVLPGGCLGLGGPEGGTLLVFPPGTRLVTAGRGVAVRVPGDPSGDPRWPARTVRPGQLIGSGSRFSEPEAVADYGGGLAEHTPEGCRRYPARPIDGGV